VQEFVQEIQSYQDRLSEAPILSSVGYLISLDSNIVPEPIRAEWISSLQTVTEQNPRRQNRQSFLYRPEELLGICLGATALRTELSEEIERLQRILHLAEGEYKNSEWWRYLIFKLGAAHLGVQWEFKRQPSVKQLSIESRALCLLFSPGEEALARKEVHLGLDLPKDELVKGVLTALLEGSFTPQSTARVAAVLQAGLWSMENLIDELVDTFYDQNRQLRQQKVKARQQRDGKQAAHARAAGRRLGRWARWSIDYVTLLVIAPSVAIYYRDNLPGEVPWILGAIIVISFASEFYLRSELKTLLGRLLEEKILNAWKKLVLGEE
jgi:hypothetical protein